jgi:hydrogenase-4 component B
MAVLVGPFLPRTWLALTLTGTLAALSAAISTITAPAGWEWTSGFLLGGEHVHLRLDGVSAIFIVLVAVVGAAGAAYAHGHGQVPRGRAWWSALLLSMVLVLTASNGIHFLMAWEAFAVCGYFLITLERKKPAVRAAGWLYLAASHAGTVCLFAFFTLLAVKTGGWDLGPMHGQSSLAPLFWLALAGFGMKAGFFPLHIWLPSAHANAPSHVSAIMSAVAIKMGIYGIVRFSGWLPMPDAAGWVVIGLGAASALLGIAFALAQDDIKRLLAYCSVENIGIILIGLGGAMLARSHGDAPWGRLALAGALLHVWNHGAFKSLLFFGAGSVLHATGTREMSRMGGLWRTMPWTTGLFALGCIAVAGLPPLNGFVSEWMIYLGLLDAVASRQSAAGAAMPAVILLAVSGALALAAFAKAGAMMFLGAPRTLPAAQAHECGAWMRGPMLLLAGLCLTLGLAPLWAWSMLATASGTWSPAWSGSTLPLPLGILGWVQLALAAMIAGVGSLLWRKVRALPRRHGLTWDCGYAHPSARMQYSSGSFAGLATGWFSWILRPARTLRRPRGYFPTEALRLERVPETVLQHLIVPAAARLMLVSSAVRRLQHGRLSAYILYVVTGLAACIVLNRPNASWRRLTCSSKATPRTTGPDTPHIR